ncbi:hypothetical protein SCYAM73S_02103 [Streptomyces cyaneofuscatus]
MSARARGCSVERATVTSWSPTPAALTNASPAEVLAAFTTTRLAATSTYQTGTFFGALLSAALSRASLTASRRSRLWPTTSALAPAFVMRAASDASVVETVRSALSPLTRAPAKLVPRDFSRPAAMAAARYSPAIRVLAASASSPRSRSRAASRPGERLSAETAGAVVPGGPADATPVSPARASAPTATVAVAVASTRLRSLVFST